MTKNQALPRPLGLLLAGFITLVTVFVLQTSTTHAATFTVAAGTDENTDNSSCSLTEAITNINGQATNEPDCVPTGAYGTDDTINLPSGTITLVASTAEVSFPVTFAGQSMNTSVIDGDGAYHLGPSADDAIYNDLTIRGFSGWALFSNAGDLTTARVNIDGTGAAISGGALFGISMQHDDGVTNGLTLTDTYVHDLSGNADTGAIAGIFLGATQNSTLNVQVAGVTLAHLNNTSSSGSSAAGITVATGVTDGSYTPATVNFNADNMTISDLTAASGAATSVGTLSFVNGGESYVNFNLRNSTLVGTRGLVNALVGNTPTALLELIGVGVQADDVANISAELTNVILADSENTQTGASNNCHTIDISAGAGGLGSAVFSLTSTGGNLSDDNSCSSYFTQPTDQNNLTNLASTLSPLADNGGFVPTMALLQNSPAIDSGVTVSGLTTDARQATRPQGTAYDSGAYESPYSKTTASLAGTGERVSFFVVTAMALVGVSAALLLKQRL